jgi:hypothetical protein
MPKLTLDVEVLNVESFEIAGADAGRGTVRAHDATRLADSCGCPIHTDGCSLYCGGLTVGCPEWSNNCWTTIEN